jgi:hypothetical protein
MKLFITINIIGVLFILSISYIVYRPMEMSENVIEFEPTLINAPIETVFSCLKNQYYNYTLWKMFDYENSTVFFEINKQITERHVNHILFTISFEYILFPIINYKIRTTLDAETKLDFENFEIKSKAISRDGLAISEPSIKLEVIRDGITKFSEKMKVSVPKIFSSYTINISKLKHYAVINNIKSATEKDNLICLRAT